MIGLPTRRLKPSDIPKEEQLKFVPPVNAEDTRRRMIKNNPMKDPKVAAKCGRSKKGICVKRITDFYEWKCLTCGEKHRTRNIEHNRERKFCDRSCQAIFTNKNRTGTYKHRPGLKRKRK